MANSVDNRVVQMEFENASFEKGIAQSLKSLEELHNKLDNGIDVKGLDDLSSKVDKISFASTIDQVDQLESRCNGLVSILKATVEELGGLSGVAVKALGGSAIAQMISGGIKRTENIEAARFQLEGLGVAWDDVRESINYAVLDTAYGADEAARAASQFVASGVQLGDEMSTSLRSISGVAAMTNSTYEDTARIFTTIAGNGRIMTMQLNQLAMRGLNAAAIMAKQWGLTEEEVRQLVHEGVIDFRTFSDAMDEAFGEHAKQANETFSGAFANMKAALSRIGADFIGPWREMERQVFLGVKDMLNNIKAGLNDYVDITDAAYSKGMGIFGDKLKSRWNAQFSGLVVDEHVQASIVSSFESFVTRFGAKVQESFHNIAESGVLHELVQSFTWALTGIFDLATSISTAFADIFEHLVLGLPTDFLKNLLDPIGNIAMSLSNFLFPLLERLTGIIDNVTVSIENLLNAGLSYIQPILIGLIEGLTGSGQGLFEFFAKGEIRLQDLSERFLEWSRSLGATDEEAAKLKSTVSGIASVVRGFAGGALTAIGGVLKNIIGVAQQLWPVISAIGNFLSAVMEPVLKLLGDAINAIGEKIGKLLGLNFGDKPFGLDTDRIQGVADAINQMAEKIRETFKDVTFENLGDKISEITGGFINLSDISATLTSAWETLSTIFGDIAERVKTLFGGNLKFENTFLGQMANFFSGKTLGGDIGGFLNDLLGVKKAYADVGDDSGGATESINDMSAAVDNFGSTISETADKSVVAADKLSGGVFDVLKTNLGNISDAVGGFISDFDFSDLLTGISMILSGFLTGVVFKFVQGLASIPGALAGALASFGSFGKTLNDTIASIGEGIEGFAKAANTVAKSELIKSIVLGIVGIAAAIFLLSLIPADKVAQSLGLIAAAVAAVGLAVVAVEVMFKTMDKAFKEMDARKIAAYSAALMSFAGVLLSLGAALLMIAGAVAILSLLDPAKAWSSFGIIALFIGEFIGLAAVLGKMAPAATTLLSMAAVILSVSVAIGVLTAAILVLSVIPWSVIGEGLAKVAVELGVLIVALALISKIVTKFSPEVMGAAAAIAALGVAILPMTLAIIALSRLSWGELLKGLVGLGVGLAALAGAVAIISIFANQSLAAMISTVPIILAMSVAVLALAAALAIIGTIPDVGPPIVALVVGIVAMTAAIAVLASVADVLVAALPTLIGMGVALVGLSISLIAFAAAMKIISTIPDVGPALLVMVAAIAALTIACAVLAAISPGLIVAGVALALIGAAFLMAGAGVLMFASAMTVLATIGPAAAMMISTSMQTMAVGVGESMKILAVKSAESITLFVQSLANGAPQIGQGAAQVGKATAQGLAQSAPDFGMAGVQAVVAFAQGLGANIGAIASAGLMAVEGFLLGVAQGIGPAIDAGAKLAIAFVNGIGDSIRNNAPLLGDAVTNVVASIFGMLEMAIADGLEAIFGPNPAADWIRQNAEGEIAAAQEASDRVNEALSEKNAENVEGQKQMMSEMTAATEEGADNMEDAASGAGDGILEGLIGSLEDGIGDFDLSALVGDSLDVESLAGLGTEGGMGIGEGFTTGSEESLNQLTPLFQGKTEEAVQAAASVDASGPGQGVGSDFGAGMYAGIESWIGPIADEAANLVIIAEERARSAMSSKSPSKLLMRDGGWFAEGFYIGIGKWFEPIAKQAETMVMQAERPILAMSDSVSDIFGALEFGDPVITPVLDLSRVEEGAGGIQSILDANSTLQFSRLSPQFGGAGDQGYYYNNEQTTYSIALDWRAGQDANDVLNDLSAAIKARNMTGGRGKHGR